MPYFFSNFFSPQSTSLNDRIPQTDIDDIFGFQKGADFVVPLKSEHFPLGKVHQMRHGHSVVIAGRRTIWRVDIRMCVHPDHFEVFVVLQDSGYRPCGNAVVASYGKGETTLDSVGTFLQAL